MSRAIPRRMYRAIPYGMDNRSIAAYHSKQKTTASRKVAMQTSPQLHGTVVVVVVVAVLTSTRIIKFMVTE